MFVIFHASSGAPVRISVKPGTLTVALGADTVDTFDACGRWLGGVEAGRYWRRGLDHRVVGAGRGERPARLLGAGARDAVLDRVHRGVAQIAADLAAGRLAATPGTSPCDVAAIEQALTHAIAFDPASLAADAQRFCALYGGPIAAFPGELYRAVYLQTTRGCAWNRCSYCTLYAGQRASVLKGDTLDQHIAAVRAYFGPALQLRRTAFLGDADAFLPGAAGLLDQFAVLHRHFAVGSQVSGDDRHPLAAIDAFGAPDSVLRCTSAELGELARLGLRRVYLGLETGCEPLRLLLQRREPLTDLRGAVERLHASGLAVGLTVLAGVGGHAWQERHIHDTTRELRRLDLNERDIVSLSPLDADPHSAYAAWAAAEAAQPLAEGEVLAQIDTLKTALADGWSGGAPRCAPYDLAALIS